MAHVWIFTEEASEGRWVPCALAGEGGRIEVGEASPRLCPPASTIIPGEQAVLIAPAVHPGDRLRWTLMVGSAVSVRVNGRELPLGVRVLSDKDEILLGEHRLFFSTEDLARPIPFPGQPQAVFCPRCKQKIERGELAVCCPGCHAWSHQSEKWPCWTYDQTCALCQAQSTALDIGYNFNPAKL